MAKRALIEHRPWLLASLIAGIAYYFVWNNPIGGVWLIVLKGAGVGLLAVYAFRRTQGAEGAILTLVLALSAAADMVLELDFKAGGVLFAMSHILAVYFYGRHRANPVDQPRFVTGIVLMILTPLVTWFLTLDWLIVTYSAWLGLMAAAAFMSRFPASRVGLGATLFIISDWLIFSRMGPYDLAPLPDTFVWPTYYAAQFMIATGVVQTLRAEGEVT
ncbi:MAG: lysoplasmalogenase family protein [Pseudomonadota bacterium]